MSGLIIPIHEASSLHLSSSSPKGQGPPESEHPCPPTTHRSGTGRIWPSWGKGASGEASGMKWHERRKVRSSAPTKAACLTNSSTLSLPAHWKQLCPFRHLTLVSQEVQGCTGHGNHVQDGLAAPELLRGQPCQEAEAALQSLPQQCWTAQTACPWGTHSAPEKPGTHAWQITSNATLGLSVSLCWLKLLLASALAFNFSPLNNYLDLPTVVFLAGIQRPDTRWCRAQCIPRQKPGIRIQCWPLPPPRHFGKCLGLCPSVSH